MAQFSDETKLALELAKKGFQQKLAAESYRAEAWEARCDEAVSALRQIYAICGEDPEVARLANSVLESAWCVGRPSL